MRHLPTVSTNPSTISRRGGEVGAVQAGADGVVDRQLPIPRLQVHHHLDRRHPAQEQDPCRGMLLQA